KTSVIISAAPPKTEEAVVTAGWLAVKTRIPLKGTERGRPIGGTDVDKLILSSGDHDLHPADDRLGFRVTRHVSIAAGKTTTIPAISLPNGSLSLNAMPWADVYIDGTRIGQTPLGNLSLPIGTHEVVFRHPDLGERKETVTLTALAPARLGVDLRKQ